MTRRMMQERGLYTPPAKQPNPTRGRLPSSAARTFYIPRRPKVMPDGRIFSIQNHMTGSIITDFYGRTYKVNSGGSLICEDN